MLRQADARRWSADVRRLLEAAWPRREATAAAEVEFAGELAKLPGRAVAPWQRTWAKEGATMVATNRDGGLDAKAPLGAWWQVGAGRVAALAFDPNIAELEAAAKMAARTPRDPQFSVTWQTGGPRLRVGVDASAEAGSGNASGNGLQLVLELLIDGAQSRQAIGQTAPGRYEVSIESPQRRGFAAVRLLGGGEPGAGQVLDRVALPGRYAPEFESIGNDYAAMGEFSRRSGGEVIDSLRTKAIDVRWPRREVDLSAVLAVAGAGMLAAGVARWRWG
jgi:hypothetical protein